MRDKKNRKVRPNGNHKLCRVILFAMAERDKQRLGLAAVGGERGERTSFYYHFHN